MRERLRPALAGLGRAAAGHPFDAEGVGGVGQRLYGWSTGGHWMVPKR